jgi:hypothetical protein
MSDPHNQHGTPDRRESVKAAMEASYDRESKRLGIKRMSLAEAKRIREENEAKEKRDAV